MINRVLFVSVDLSPKAKIQTFEPSELGCVGRLRYLKARVPCRVHECETRQGNNLQVKIEVKEAELEDDTNIP